MSALLVAFAGADHDAIFPVPEATKPIAGFELAHTKVDPEGLLVNAAGAINAPGQTDIGDNP